MARNTYKAGEWNVWCMVCNKKIKSGEALKRWDGLLVCHEDYENRHPLDFLRTRQERISVPFSAPTTFTNFDGPVYPAYPFCTAEGSSGVAGLAFAGCLRPHLGYPNGLPNLVPEIPDEPPVHVSFLQLVQGGTLLLMSGGALLPVKQ